MRYFVKLSLVSILISVMTAGCTAVITAHPPHKPQSIVIGGEVEKTGAKKTNPTNINEDGEILCPLYEPPEFPSTPTLESQMGNLDELDHDPRLAVDRLLQYIRQRDVLINNFRKERRDVYEAYLKTCLSRK